MQNSRALCKHPKGCHDDKGLHLVYLTAESRTWTNALKLQPSNFRLEIGKKGICCQSRKVMEWKSREGASLEGFKKRVDS